ncbi:MAG: SagB/ThcOx family dehydrogenase [Actinomycetota bacterium]|nr:SagB/ThcOx family dehydrogenase [Actinomycetota bacterium]
MEYNPVVVRLPEPRYRSSISVEEAILRRRSIRRYKDEPLALEEVSQLLWAAQGITEPYKGLRAAPSAGALYPLETYLVAGNVNSLPAGVYKYRPFGHDLIKTLDGDIRTKLAIAAINQTKIKKAAASIVFSAVYERTVSKYGNRGIRYVHMDLGLAAENVYLQAVSLGLGTLAVGAFDDLSVKVILDMPQEEYPLCIMPIGRV